MQINEQDILEKLKIYKEAIDKSINSLNKGELRTLIDSVRTIGEIFSYIFFYSNLDNNVYNNVDDNINNNVDNIYNVNISNNSKKLILFELKQHSKKYDNLLNNLTSFSLVKK